MFHLIKQALSKTNQIPLTCSFSAIAEGPCLWDDFSSFYGNPKVKNMC